MSANEMSCEWITDETGFLALQPEWDRLWQAAAGRPFTHSFTWFRTGWLTTGKPRGRSLCILVVRQAGVAALIWPMALRRRWFAVEAIALGPEFTEYDPVLVADGPDAARIVQAAWDFLRVEGKADVVKLPFVRQGSPMHGLLTEDPTPRTTETLPSPYLVWEDFGNWETYWRSRGKKTRDQINRRQRRLAEMGEVTFGLVEDPAEFKALLEWTLKIKAERMAEKGLDNDYMHTPEFKPFLVALHGSPAPQGQWVMFALKIDGRTIAAKMGALDAQTYEGFISAQDPEFAKLSAGTIILVKTLEWLAARGLSYDFRIGEEAYKLDWANRDRPATTFVLAVTPVGVAALACERASERLRCAKDRVRLAIPPELRARVKAWARSPLASVAQGIAHAVEYGQLQRVFGAKIRTFISA